MGFSASSVIVAIAVSMVCVFVVKNMLQYHIASRAGKIWYVRKAQSLQYSPNLEPVISF
jgi:cell division protein FtsX